MKTFELTVGGKAYKVEVERFDGKHAVVKVDGKSYDVDVQKAAEAFFPGAPPVTYSSTDTQNVAPVAPEPPASHVASVPSGGEVIAPMPGLVLDVMVSTGEHVVVGTPVVKIEAMKMENEIPAPANGTVKEVLVKVGDRVSTDETLLVIDQE